MLKRKKIPDYAASSKLMNILVTYGDEKFSFNLYEELVIDEDKINSEAQSQPSSYAFLNMLYKKLFRLHKQSEYKLEKKYKKLFLRYKKDKDPLSGKSMANDMVEAMVVVNPEYQEILAEHLELEGQLMAIEVCVKGFEQRVNLIQTLSANIRKG
jgi:hypothetical protein